MPAHHFSYSYSRRRLQMMPGVASVIIPSVCSFGWEQWQKKWARKEVGSFITPHHCNDNGSWRRTTLNMIFSVTNSNCLGSILIANCSVVSPTVNISPTFFVISGKAFGGIIDLQCCNYCPLPSDVSSKLQSSMTTFHQELMTREGRLLANERTYPSSFMTRVREVFEALVANCR
jgi:hypothetical protein